MGRDSTNIVPIRLVDNLPFVSVALDANDNSLTLDNVLLDTGSAGCIFSADVVLDLDLVCAGSDDLIIVTGVGGSEYVFSKVIDRINVGPLSLSNFKIEIGAMDYGFELDGILGMSFLLPTEATLDFRQLTLTSSLPSSRSKDK